jgi:hypothetical protein
MSGFKYGMLVLPSREGIAACVRMNDTTELVPAKLDTVMDLTQAKHWGEWIGSIEWKQLVGADALVITRIPSDTPELMDGETQQLQARAVTSWFSSLLADPHPFTRGKAWILSGPCAGLTPGGRLLDVRSLAREELVSPFFSELNEYWDSLGNDVMLRSDESNAAWARRFVEIDAVLQQRLDTKLPAILHVALRSFRSAVARREMEFRIPELVRAAEGVIALPKGAGRELFRDRAQQLAPDLKTDPFVGGELGTLLLELYDLRSACVHGKVPFLNLQKLGDAGALRAAKLSFVSEKLARAALLVALRSNRVDVFATREGLERAWKEKTFP